MNVGLFKLLKMNTLLSVLIQGILYEHELHTVDFTVVPRYKICILGIHIIIAWTKSDFFDIFLFKKNY